MHELDLPWLGPVLLPVPALMALWGLIEGLSLPLPMPGGVVVGGLAAALRPTWLQMAVWAVYASIGYCLGASVAYWVGQKAREHSGIQRMLARIGLGPERLAALDGLFARYGRWAVAWTRPLWIGNYISLPAGLARMPFLPFLGLTWLGIYPTALLFLWAGEEMARLTEQYGTAVVWGTIAVAAAVLAVRYVWKRRAASRAVG